MPSNQDFTMKISVGKTTLPEYENNGVCYVESNFFTPYSYVVRSEDEGAGESQNCPVTPYQIILTPQTSSDEHYYRIIVDGYHVKSCSARPGQTRSIKGFREFQATREFLFSLPNFNFDQAEVTCDRQLKNTGTITVECYNARKVKVAKTVRDKPLNYSQASKKDCSKMTGGKFLMSTTKVGKVIKIKQKFKSTDFWQRESSPRSCLTVKYATADTLGDLGFTVIPITFPNKKANSSILCSLSALAPRNISNAENTSEKTAMRSEKNTSISQKDRDSSMHPAADEITLITPKIEVDSQSHVNCLQNNDIIVID